MVFACQGRNSKDPSRLFPPRIRALAFARWYRSARVPRRPTRGRKDAKPWTYDGRRFASSPRLSEGLGEVASASRIANPVAVSCTFLCSHVPRVSRQDVVQGWNRASLRMSLDVSFLSLHRDLHCFDRHLSSPPCVLPSCEVAAPSPSPTFPADAPLPSQMHPPSLPLLPVVWLPPLSSAPPLPRGGRKDGWCCDVVVVKPTCDDGADADARGIRRTCQVRHGQGERRRGRRKETEETKRRGER